MNPPGPQIPDHMTIREAVTDGPVPEFDPDPEISLDNIGDVAPGDVLIHAHDHLIVIDIELGECPEDAEITLFNQRTTITNVVQAGELAKVISSAHPMFHFSDIVIPADATYHVDEDEPERGLPRAP